MIAENTRPTHTEPTPKPCLPQEGWHVVHLFFKINRARWASIPQMEQEALRLRFVELVAAVRAHPSTQILLFSMVGPKSDFGVMLLTPDLHDADRFSKAVAASFGADVLDPVYSYLSMTELSEYTTTEQQFSQELETKEGLVAGSEAFEARLNEWRARMKKYNADRLYPNMPDWQVFCFYNMSKRRNVEQNWYASDYETRRKLMGGHAKTGRTWAGKVRQLITGSTGLDAAEWGVTLFAHDTFHIKGIVYEMRFDEVSAVYAEFGDFYIGIQLPVDALLDRLMLR
ncbi:MAG: heme-dependent peroxidase [Verrucomicrobiaceae bacterium]|nr:heme-dependent peroxidase [Verrucomicrobiaceae bacterium]